MQIKADGVAKTDNGYHAWFNFGPGDYMWSSAVFSTEKEAREYGKNFVKDYNKLREAVKDVQP